jgi:hypothetical protein
MKHAGASDAGDDIDSQTGPTLAAPGAIGTQSFAIEDPNWFAKRSFRQLPAPIMT